MNRRLITSERKADMILNKGLITGKVNNFAQKEFDKPFGPKEGYKSAAFTASRIGTDLGRILVAIVTACILVFFWWWFLLKKIYKALNLQGVVEGFLGQSLVECHSIEIEEKNEGYETLQERRAVPLQELTDEWQQSVPASLAQLVNSANSSYPQIRYYAVTSLRELLSTDHPPVDLLICCNVLPALVDCLSSQNPALQLEAASALTNIAAGTSEQTQAVVQAGAVPHLVRLLKSPYQDVCEHAVWVLGNIIADGRNLRDYVIDQGVVVPLLNCIQPDIPITFLHKITWAIKTLYCCYPEVSPPPQTLREILPALNVLVHHKDTTVLVDTLKTYFCLIEGGKERIQMVIDSGVVPRLVQLLNHREGEVQEAAIRAVGDILTGTADQKQIVLNCLRLSDFHNLLNHTKESIYMGSLYLLGMVTGKSCTIEAVIDNGLIPRIVHHLEKGEFKTQKAAAWAVIKMAIHGNKEHLVYLVNCGVIPPFCNFLNCKDSEELELIPCMLQGILNILKIYVNQDGCNKVCPLIKECGGLEKIESLQYHESIQISKIAHEIIGDYFSDDVEDDASLAPEAAENAVQFKSNAAMPTK